MTTPAHSTPRVRGVRTALATLALAFTVTSTAVLARGDGAPPDLKIEWVEGPAAVEEAEPLRGAAGDRLTVELRIRNVGGAAAFAVVVDAHTAIGRHGRPRRFQPGPEPGGSLRHRFELSLANGMRELCVAVRLQRADADEPADPNPENNKVCRAVELHGRGESDARDENGGEGGQAR